MKKNFVRIDFTNGNNDFYYTIQPWSEVNEYLEDFKDDVATLDEQGFNEWQQKGYLPEVKLSIVQMTDEEYEEWFIKHIENNA